MIHDRELELLPLRSEPLTAPRATVYGEGIFLETWRALLAEPVPHGDGLPNEMIEHILCDTVGPIDERVASVAASFIVWLGCNAGQSFLDHASKLSRAHALDLPEAFTLAWAEQNRRRVGVNSSRRSIEFIIPGEVTFRDAEIIENVARWLGTPKGIRMRALAMAEIEATRKALQERNSMETRARVRAAEIAKAGGSA
jgi:hypothetical protein